MSSPLDGPRAGQRRPSSLKRSVLVAFALALVAYVLLLATVNVADRVLLFPSREEIPALWAEPSLLPYEGGEIEVWKARSQPGVEPRAFVLRFYGNADRPERHVAHEAMSYRGQQIELWGVSFPGFGKSSGRASLAGVARAGEVAYAALAERAKGRPIFVVGTSMGSTAALHLAATVPVAGAVLHDAPPLARLLVGEHGLWNLWLLALPVSWQVPRELDSIDNARRSTAPAVFITSGNDTLVPPRYQQLIVEAYAGPKEAFVVPGAPHTGDIPRDVAEEIAGAFSRMYDRALGEGGAKAEGGGG